MPLTSSGASPNPGLQSVTDATDTLLPTTNFAEIDTSSSAIVTAGSCVLTLSEASLRAIFQGSGSLLVKDTGNQAAVNNIIISPPSGTVNGLSSIIINSNGGSVQLWADPVDYWTP